MATLGIDAGATATKWATSDGRFGSTLPMDGHVGKESSVARMKEVLNTIASAQNDPITSVVAGITGLDTSESGREITNKFFADAFPKAKVTLWNDMELAYRAHFNLGEGMLLYSGTGSIASFMELDGTFLRTGGWGYLLGDEGSGYWIGREAIRHALWQLESGEKFDSCTEGIMRELNSHSWPEIRSFVYSNERSKIAALAKLVSHCAEEGLEVALQIMTDAADELAALILRLEKRAKVSGLQIHLAGGVGANSEILLSLLIGRLGNRVTIVECDIAKRAAEIAGD